MSIQADVQAVLREALGLQESEVQRFDRETPLFGALPEFDSMAVVTVVLELELKFDIEIDGEEIDADTFATVGSLTDFVAKKVDLQTS